MLNGNYLYFLFFLQSLITLQVAIMWNKNDSKSELQAETPKHHNEIEKMLQDGIALFSGGFLYKALRDNPEGSAVMSAFSVYALLAELTLYAGDHSLSQLLTHLNLFEKSQIMNVLPNILRTLRAEKNLTLNMASRIFVSNQRSLSHNFLSDIKQVFEAGAENLDFCNPEAAAERINQWVKDETNNRIQDVASPDMFDLETNLVLVNAVYFMGNWLRQFSSKDTVDRPFHINTKETKNIPTMYQEDYFKYGFSNDLDCSVLEMLYKGNNFSLVIFLPNKIDGLIDMVEKLHGSTKFYEAYDSIRYAKVQVFLPKIKIESEYNLIQYFQTMETTEVLDKPWSALSGILETDKPISVSVAKQKAIIMFDERGSDVVATNVFGTITRKPHVKIFKADHPFAFYIMNKRNIIFSGFFAN